MDHSSAALGRARTAIAAIFFLNGTLLASWVPHIPIVKARLAVDEAALGGLLLMMALGALVAFPTTSYLIGRFGSRAVTVVVAVLLAAFLPLPVLSTTPARLAMALFVFGAANGALDVAMNAQAIGVERHYGRPILSSLHALFSVGGMAGAGVAAVFLATGATATQHALSLSLIGIAVTLSCAPLLLRSDAAPATPSPVLVRPERALVGIGALAFLGLMIEGSMADWSALFLHETLDASRAFAATGFAVFSVTMAAGRFAGDALAARTSSRRLLRTSAVLAAAGMATSLVVAHPLVAIAGFAAVGFGIANVIPILFRSAAAASQQHPERALAATTTMGYLGLLAGPAIIGFVAGATSLSIALGLVALACVLIAAFGGAAAKDVGHPIGRGIE
ncbi:MAG TPA: MFS transporter [Candidatus Binatia bacterium]|nr:MFS transporter [Candidatus Binatia bacterium]